MALQISRFADYGLRGVLYLALQPEGRAVPLSEVARATDVSPHYLSKIFQLLSQAGLIRVRRGSQGGYSLAVSREKLTPRVVLERLTGKVELTECLTSRSPCSRRFSCPYVPMWARAQKAFLAVLEEYTYARLARRREK